MTEKEILDKLMKIIRDDIEIQDEININSSLLQEKVMDSMDWISFLTRVEEEFEMEIPPEEADGYAIAIIENMVKYIKEKIK